MSECGQRVSSNLAESGSEVLDNLVSDDIGIGKVGAVFEALSQKSVKIC